MGRFDDTIELGRALAKISSMKMSHKKEVTKLRMELSESKKKCQHLQQQIDSFCDGEKNLSVSTY